MTMRSEQKQNMRSGILICGSYGLGNAGDESILCAILQEMRSVAPDAEITVLSRNPSETAARYGVKTLHMFNLFSVHRAMKHTRLYINGGGNLIQDVTSRRNLWYYLYTLRTAKKCGCKVMMYGCGIGPIRYQSDINLTRKTLNRFVDVITLREEYSLQELRRFGVTNPEISLSSDPALSLSPADDDTVDEVLLRNGLLPNGRYLGICLRTWPSFDAPKMDAFAALARYAKDTCGLTPLFLSINHRNDATAAAQVVSRLDFPCCILREPLRAEVAIGIMSRMQAVFSMRLHGLIFAAGQGIPVVGVVYDPKVSAFLSYLGQDSYLDLPAVSDQALTHALDIALTLRDQRDVLAASAQRLRAIESENCSAAKRLYDRP